MDFNDTPEQAKFRKTCLEWLEKNASYKDKSSKGDSFANKDLVQEAKSWQKKQ